MAIFPDVAGVEVTVLMNGVAMKEYNDDEEVETNGDELSQYQTSKTVSKYIESETDQEFSIELSVKQPYKFASAALSFQILVDGREAINPLLMKKDFNSTTGWNKVFAGVKSLHSKRDWKIQNFKFATIKTTTEDLHGIQNDSTRIDKVGEIVVWVYRRSNLKRNKFQNSRGALDMQHDGVVHEKALKRQAKSHGTVLGKARETAPAQGYSSKKIDGDGRPIAIYKFNYRSLAALQSLLILPYEHDVERVSPPGPPPTPNSRLFVSPEPKVECPSAPTSNSARHHTIDTLDPESTIETATAEEKRLMAAFLATIRGGGQPQVKTETRSIKREGDHAEGFTKRVKQESASELVDLTDD